MDEEEDDFGVLGQLSELLSYGGLGVSEEALGEARSELSRYKSYLEGEEQRPEEVLLDRMRQNAEEVQSALRQARERIVAQRYNPGEAWLAASAALGAPTRTGAFGESVANAAGVLSQYAGRKGQFERDREGQLLNIDTALAKADEGVMSAELQLAMLERRMRNAMAQEAMRTMRMSGGRQSSASRQREVKIRDAATQLVNRLGWDLDRAWDHATNIVDGHERIEIDEALGIARGINELTGETWEVPLSGSRGGPQTPPGGQTPPGSGTPVAFTPAGEPSTDVRDLPPQDLSLWDAATSYAGTGLWSGLGAGWNVVAGNVGLPIIPQVETARQSIRSGAQRMLRALSTDPEDPSAREIQRIHEEINILPTIGNNPPVMAERLRSIDSDLRDLYRRAIADMDDPTLSARYRTQRETLAAEIRNFLPKLGVPQPGAGGGGQAVDVPDWVPAEDRALWQFYSEEGKRLIEQMYGPGAGIMEATP